MSARLGRVVALALGLLAVAPANAAKSKTRKAPASSKVATEPPPTPVSEAPAPESPVLGVPVSEPLEAPPAAPAPASDDGAGLLTGGVELASRYVQRGLSSNIDNDGVALQPYLDVALPWGFTLGYWGSSTAYGRELQVGAEAVPMRAFENDFSLLWGLDLGQAELRLGVTYYLILAYDGNDVAESVVEFEVRPTAGDVTLGTAVVSGRSMLWDCGWGNQLDTYLQLRYDHDFNERWAVAADLGWHGYRQGPLETREKLAFRHMDFSIVRSAPQLGMRLRLTGMLGGVDRLGAKQPPTLLWAVGWEF